MKYGLYDKHIISIDDENIIYRITNIDETIEYKRIGTARKKYICGKKLPDSYDNLLYESIDILKKANRLYDFTKDLEKCGMYTDYYFSGNIKEKYFHNKGIKEGVYYYFYDDLKNNIKFECNYINNILHGLYIKYYDNGNIELKSYYDNGKLNGEYIYYPNRNEQNEYHKFLYINDSREGELIYESQKSISKGLCVNNAII